MGRKPSRYINEKGEIRCPKCERWLPTKCFLKDSRTRLGFYSLCKECKRNAQSKSYARNPEAGRERCKKLSTRFANSQFTAKKRNYEWTLNFAQYSFVVGLPCIYCGGKLSEIGVGLDRVDNTMGYIPTNVVPCCAVCNWVKSDIFTYEEMKHIGDVIREIRTHREVVSHRKSGRKRKARI